MILMFIEKIMNMKSVQRIIFSILTLVVIMSMANPVFAEEQKKVKLYDTEMNLISTFQSETELENYLENKVGSLMI